MFSLIISVAAIVFIALLTAATFYYGGDIFSDGKKQADSAGLINQSQQIAAAVEIYSADNGSANPLVNMSDLEPFYLKSVPPGWDLSSVSLTAVSGYVAYPISGDDDKKLSVCEDVNKKLGIAGAVPACTSIPVNFTGCCTSS